MPFRRRDGMGRRRTQANGETRSQRELNSAAVAQLVERVLGKDEVTGPSPVSSFEYFDCSSNRRCVAAILSAFALGMSR